MMNIHMQQGLEAVKARNNQDAVRFFEKALQETPEDAEARAWLGQSLCSAGKRAEGIRHLCQAGRQYLEKTPVNGDISKTLEIVMLLQQWNDFEGALGLLNRAIPLNSTDHRALSLLSTTYSQLNRTAEALLTVQKALELDPENSMLHILQGSLEADAGKYATARLHLEDVLSFEIEPREEFRAHKELARVLDKLGEYDKVFDHLQASAELSGAIPEICRQDITLVPEMIKQNKAGFSRELLGRWSGAVFPKELPPPVFLVGFMRSGTTLTQEVLDVHPDVFVADEADFIWALHRELQQMDGSNASTAEKLARLQLADVMHLREFYWNRVRGRFDDKIGQRLLIDKFTMNTIDLGLINFIFPDAKVIFVMRDPRDVCLSCLLQLMVPTAVTTHLLNLQDTARLYAQVMDWWLYVKQQMTLDFIEFRYEDAVAMFEPTYRTVFEFLGLTWDPAALAFHKHAAGKYIASPSRQQVAQPLYSSSVSRWRHYENKFSQVSELLQPFVIAFKYDRTDNNSSG